MSKKVKLLICLIMAVAITISGVVIALFVFNNKHKPVYAESVIVNKSKIILELGDSYTVENDIDVLPKNCTEKLMYSTNDSRVASVDIFTGTITANIIGTCKIIISIKTDAVNKITKTIDVQVIDRIIYPSSVSFDTGNKVLVKNESISLNFSAVGEFNVVPTIKTKNNLVSYNFETDTLTALGVGTEQLEITFPISKDDNLTFTLNIEILEKNIVEDTIYINKNSFYMYNYNSQSESNEITVEIIEGNDLIELTNIFYKSFTIITKNVGYAKIEINSPTENIIVNVFIE